MGLKNSPRIRRRYSVFNDATLFNGDCLALLKMIPPETAQLVITSPPYNIGKAYEKSLTLDDYLKKQCAVIEECVRILKPGGSICWQVGHHVNRHRQLLPLDLVLHPLFARHEESDQIRLRNRIVWHFEHGLNCKRRFSGRHETILWYTKGDSYTFNLDSVRIPQKYPGKKAYKGSKKGHFSGNPLGKNPGDVWNFPNVKNNHVEKTVHPCQFPVELAEKLVLALSNRGDLIADPFIGVGTTAVAAVMHDRRAAGADVVPEYLQIAHERIQKAACGTLKYRPANKPVYVPKPGTPLTIMPPHFSITGKSESSVSNAGLKPLLVRSS